MKELLKDKLKCPECGGAVVQDNSCFVCCACKRRYKIIDGNIIFKENFTQDNKTSVRSSDKFISRLKRFFRRYPILFRLLTLTVGAFFVGKSAKSLVNKMSTGSFILNIGAGPQKINHNVINLDISPFPATDIVADAHHLPIIDNCVDLVICDFVLEHVLDPDMIINEIHRVLKKDGMVYVATPFIIGFHSCPADYYRWTESGLRERMKKFREMELNVRCGPSSAFVAVLSEWFAIIFSFGIIRVYEILLLISLVFFLPLKFIDFIYYKFGPSRNIALGFYFIGKKI